MNLNNTPLVRSLGSQDADAVREVNSSNQYYWMLNKYGRKVPVAIHIESDCLRRGFIHTDRIVYSDDLSKRVVAPPPVTPMEVMAKLAEKMVESNETTKEALAAVVDEAPKKRAGRPKKSEGEEVTE